MKKNIALVTGGFSGEAVISYKSAATIDNNLDRERFNVYKIDINPKGWFYESPDGGKAEIDKNDFSLPLDGQRIRFDAVFIGIGPADGRDDIERLSGNSRARRNRARRCSDGNSPCVRARQDQV